MSYKYLRIGSVLIRKESLIGVWPHLERKDTLVIRVVKPSFSWETKTIDLLAIFKDEKACNVAQAEMEYDVFDAVKDYNRYGSTLDVHWRFLVQSIGTRLVLGLIVGIIIIAILDLHSANVIMNRKLLEHQPEQQNQNQDRWYTRDYWYSSAFVPGKKDE